MKKLIAVFLAAGFLAAAPWSALAGGHGYSGHGGYSGGGYYRSGGWPAGAFFAGLIGGAILTTVIAGTQPAVAYAPPPAAYVPPPPAQVAVKAITYDSAKSPFDRVPAEANRGVGGIGFKGKSQGCRHSLADVFISEPLCSRLFCGPIDGSPKQSDLNKVV